MIAHVSGQVAEKTDDAIIIDVHGVGYEVQVASGDYEGADHGQQIKLYTHYHVRETEHQLFGFSTLVAKRLFELLISVSGVGPKMALAILSLGDIESIRSAIALGDSAFVQRASGVGKRIAERIAVDLRDKVGLPGAGPVAGIAPRNNGVNDDALDALLALGYSLQQANEALLQTDSAANVQNRIKQALQILSRL
ncbi:MAG: Holliday junction branch migration protein RuvA [Candidatus Woesebacteria bacterium]|jgi:Holliday junction DNA helicase RuvA